MNTTILMTHTGITIALDFYEGLDKASWLETMADWGWSRFGEIWE